MRKALSIFLTLLLCLVTHAQGIRMIKEDPSYIWGEGSGADYESAQSSAVDALIAKLAASDLLPVPGKSRIPLWNTYRSDIIAVSEVSSESGTVLRYISWKDVERIFARRKNLVSELASRAGKAAASGRKGEAGTCLDWARTLMEALPADSAMDKKLSSMAGTLGQVTPTDIPSLSYIAREVSGIRSALRSGPQSVKPAPLKLPQDPRNVSVTMVPKGSRDSERSLPDILPAAVLPGEMTVPVKPAGIQLASRPVSPSPLTRQDAAAVPTNRLSFLVLAQAAALPTLQPGLMVGAEYGRIGGYLSFRNSFPGIKEDYICSADGITDFGHIWATGNSKWSGYSLSGGILLGIKDWLSVYAGAGYGESSLFWEDVSGQWAKVSDMSLSGLSMETGIIFKVNYFSILVGSSSISAKSITPVFGVGFSF